MKNKKKIPRTGAQQLNPPTVDEISTRWNRFAMKSAFGRLYKNAINRWRTTWWIDTSCHDLALPWFLTSLHELNCIRNVRRTIHAVGNSWRHRLQFMHLADAIRCRLIASANKKRTQLGAFCFALIDVCLHFALFLFSPKKRNKSMKSAKKPW